MQSTRGREFINGASSVSDDRPCTHCNELVYWAPFYDKTGSQTRKLFTTKTHRPHDCSAQPDPDGFDIINEEVKP